MKEIAVRHDCGAAPCPGCRKARRDELAPLVEAVKAHALENYNAGGWDVLVECWSDEDIAEVIQQDQALTPQEAIQAFRAVVDVWADRQADAINSAF